MVKTNLPVTLVILLGLAAPSAGQVPPQGPKLKDWKAYYARANATNPENAFYQYAVLQTARRRGEPLPSVRATRTGKGRWDGQVYEMTTGAAAIQETLQLDRLAGSGDVVGKPEVPVASVKGVATPSIPFEKLMGGRAPTLEPLASAAPADDYYVHFGKVSAMRRVLHSMDRWGTHLLSAYQVTGRDNHLREKLERQLLLQARPDLDPFYDLVVGDVAIVGSDPYLAEGSDCTVLFTLKNEMLFRAHLEAERAQALVSRPGASKVHELYRDWTVDGVVSGDRSLSSLSAIHNGIAVVSNSREALHAIVDVVEGRAHSLAESPDFKYMRAEQPYAESQEDAFVFLSDELVRRVVGPRRKIGEARRVRCAVSLQTAGFAEMMFRAELGRAPASLEELVQTRYLDSASLRCPERGEFRLEGNVPVCSIHNRLGQLTPNLELESQSRLDRVTAEEAKAYDSFREGYKAYWRRYIDPVGVRVRSREALSRPPQGGTLDVEVTILPLVENSIYSDALQGLGTEPVALARPQLASAVATFDAKIPRKLLSEGSRDVYQRLFERAVGDHFSVQVGDGAPPVAMDLSGFASVGRSNDWMVFSPLMAALTLPTAIVVPVQDHAALQQFLAKMRADVATEASNDPWFQVDDYQLVESGRHTVEAYSLRLFMFKWRFFYTVAGDWLIVATDRDMIDQLAQAPPSGQAQGAMRLELAPGRWKRIAPALALGYAEESRRVCQANLGWLEALHAAFGDLGAESLALLGATFACPDNGSYQLGSDGHLECALHGTRTAPRQGPRPQAGSPAAFMLEGVRRMEATASFTKSGFSARVHIEESGVSP